MQRLHLQIAVVFVIQCACFSPNMGLAAVADRDDRSVISPNGEVKFQLLEGDATGLQYQVTRGSHVVIEPSRIGIVIDGLDLGDDAKVERVEQFDLDEQFETRGVSSTAANRCRGAQFSLVNGKSGTPFTLYVRAFDDGVAFRFLVPGKGTRAPDAGIEFTIPAGSTVWTHGLGGHYEGVHTEQLIEDLEAGDWIAPPLTFKLPHGAGYAAITEGYLVNYAGMALQVGENGIVRERLGHSQPVGHPFELRFSDEDAERLSHAATIEGDVIAPWRVVMIGKDLNTLVNCSILESLSSPPDKNLFPKGLRTSWVKPGRSVWKFLDGGESNLQGMKDFSRWAGELGFEYNLIEGFWQRWSEEELQSLVDYSRDYNVEIWLWKDSRALRLTRSEKEVFHTVPRCGRCRCED